MPVGSPRTGACGPIGCGENGGVVKSDFRRQLFDGLEKKKHRKPGGLRRNRSF